MPWEERHEKKARYELICDGHKQGRRQRVCPSKLASRLCRVVLVQDLGYITGQKGRKAIQNTAEAAETTSRWLCMKMPMEICVLMPFEHKCWSTMASQLGKDVSSSEIPTDPRKHQ